MPLTLVIRGDMITNKRKEDPMLTSQDVADALQTDVKTARRFLRAVLPHTNDHQRWEVPEEDLDMLKLLFLVRRLGRDDMLKLLIK